MSFIPRAREAGRNAINPGAPRTSALSLSNPQLGAAGGAEMNPIAVPAQPLPARRETLGAFRAPVRVGTGFHLLSPLHPTFPRLASICFLVSLLAALWIGFLAMLIEFSGKKNVMHVCDSHSKSSSK